MLDNGAEEHRFINRVGPAGDWNTLSVSKYVKIDFAALLN